MEQNFSLKAKGKLEIVDYFEEIFFMLNIYEQDLF